jgi:hypothetical protein
VSDRNSCCHCRASCEEPSDSCDYSDAPAADDDDEDDAPAADDDDEDEDGEFTGDTEGSCYDLQDTHTVSCGVTRDDCMEIEGVWYRPGHISTYSGSDCCHCRANCPAEGLTEGCNFYDEDAETSTSPPSGQGPEEDPVQDSGAYAVLGVALLLF